MYRIVPELAVGICNVHLATTQNEAPPQRVNGLVFMDKSLPELIFYPHLCHFINKQIG